MDYQTEHELRKKQQTVTPYDPLTGAGCGGRRTFEGGLWLPEALVADKRWQRKKATKAERHRLRCQYDFEYWAYTSVKIIDKLTKRRVAFKLNRGQRKVAGVLERQRAEGRPLRLIVLKSRQWGCSTLVQIYMAWLQLQVCENWHSYICAHVKNTAAMIKVMYENLLADYPDELEPPGEKRMRFGPVKGSANTYQIETRGCQVTIGSSEAPEASRGLDLSMAHLSEVAFWRDSRLKTPEDVIASVTSGIAAAPLTLVVMESTANGVGNYFHREWERAVAGESDLEPVFVAWHENDDCRLPFRGSAEAFAKSFNDYDRRLWKEGLDLEQIAWHRHRRTSAQSLEMVMAEFPTWPVEAFSATGAGVFSAEQVERLRRGCVAPRKEADGTEVWAEPVTGARYVASVDVGGRSANADWSVVAVLRAGERPEVVAQWRGHIDHDLLIKQAVKLARRYNRAELVVESNTLESAGYAGEAGAVLMRLEESGYEPLYRRVSGGTLHTGFHTNVRTKAAAIAGLVEAVREGYFVERSQGAVDEFATYRREPNGAYSARRGCHDDMLMTRAIALAVIAADPSPDQADLSLPHRLSRW